MQDSAICKQVVQLFYFSHLLHIDTNNLQKVDAVKRNIIQLYEDDFRKIDATGRLSKMFRSIPGMLSRNMTRYSPASVIGNTNEEKMAELLLDLEDSRTVNFVWHCDDPHVGMGLTRDMSKFKLFVGDTGLFITLAFWDKDFTENIIYQKLLSDKLDANIGYVYENLTSQMLKAAGNELFYYTWQKDEKHYYEVDFLLSRGHKICPVEVKSSGYNKTHASLDAFCDKFSERVLWRYLISANDYAKDHEVQFIPFYMVSFL